MDPQRPLLLRAAAYPSLYTWFVFFSSIDLLFTWLILHSGGREVNTIADWIIANFDLPGIVVYKFFLVVFVVTVCEILSRRRYDAGRKLARWAIVLSAFPVVFGAGQMLGVVVLGGYS
jgi:hypothetical protein